MLQFNQTTLAMDAAANGQGVALAPRILLSVELEQGRLVQLWQDERTNQDGYYLVYPRKRQSSPARDALIEWALAETAKDRAQESDFTG
jgi:LysR family glycine cleavage system transcriptional activator